MNKDKVQEYAGVIVTNQEAIRESWRKIDHYKKYQVLASDEQKVYARNVTDMSIGQIITACFTLPPYISKYQKKYDSMPDGPEKIKLGIELQTKQKELEDIKALRE